jgi:hypothetical protein
MWLGDDELQRLELSYDIGGVDALVNSLFSRTLGTIASARQAGQNLSASAVKQEQILTHFFYTCMHVCMQAMEIAR